MQLRRWRQRQPRQQQRPARGSSTQQAAIRTCVWGVWEALPHSSGKRLVDQISSLHHSAHCTALCLLVWKCCVVSSKLLALSTPQKRARIPHSTAHEWHGHPTTSLACTIRTAQQQQQCSAVGCSLTLSPSASAAAALARASSPACSPRAPADLAAAAAAWQDSVWARAVSSVSACSRA